MVGLDDAVLLSIFYTHHCSAFSWNLGVGDNEPFYVLMTKLLREVVHLYYCMHLTDHEWNEVIYRGVGICFCIKFIACV